MGIDTAQVWGKLCLGREGKRREGCTRRPLASENLITMLKKLLGRVLWPKRAGARSRRDKYRTL